MLQKSRPMFFFHSIGQNLCERGGFGKEYGNDCSPGESNYEIMEFTLTEKQHVQSVYWDLVRLDGDGISKRIRDVKRTEQIGII
jgi:hypothetical protein